jgi:hypothetical protein
MNYLLIIRTIKPAWLIAFSTAGLIGANDAYAKGWVITSWANKKTPNKEISDIYSDTKYANTDTTSPDGEMAPAGHSIDRGVLQIESESGSKYRSSSYKINGNSEAPEPSSVESSDSGPEVESSDSGPEPASNILENLEASPQAGKGKIYPVAKVSLGYRDDVYETDDNLVTEEKGAATLEWEFGGGYQGSNRGHLNGLEYTVQGNEFLSGNSNENEISQQLNGYWGTAFTPRHHLDLGAEYVDDYDPRGKGDSHENIRFNTFGQEADQWNQLTVGGTYSFGNKSAKGRIELSAYQTSRDYENNSQQYRSRDQLDMGAAVYLKIMAKTEYSFRVMSSDLNYVDQGQENPTLGRNLDSDEMHYLVGVKWEPSENLNGTFEVGTVQKTFNTNSARQDYGELTWDSSVVWSPDTRNKFSLSYSRSLTEAFVYSAERLIDDYIEIENLNVSWSHSLGERINTIFTYRLSEDSYLPSDRKDDRNELAVSLSYALPRWGTIGLTYFNRQRESSVADQNYDNEGFFVSFNLGAALGLGDGNRRAPKVRNKRAFKPVYNVY